MQKGYILIWVLYAFLLILPLSVFSLRLVSSNYSFALDWEAQTQALYCAEAGLMHAVEWIKAKNPPSVFQAEFSGGSYSVEIIPTDKKTYLVRARGEKNGQKRVVEMEILDGNFKVIRWEEVENV